MAAADQQRPLAVLFCDIVGSTSYLKKLGAENWFEALREFHAATTEVVVRLGGHVAQHLGDGQLIYFGYPEAHEDDPRRAVEAGLGIIEAVSALNARLLYRGWPELNVRIGIATGRVILGAVGSRLEALAHGETTHLASRLQNLADPGTVVVDEVTRRLASGYFVCEPLGDRAPKDFARLTAYRVLGRTGARTRLDVSVTNGLSPFVGRADEMAALRGAWEEALHGLPRSVLIKGEPGIGKSRLLQGFKSALDGGDYVFECHCSPLHQNSAFFPIVEMLERLLGIRPDQSNAEKLEKLERWVGGSSALGASALGGLAPLFSVARGQDAPEMSPHKQRQLAFDSLLAWLRFLGRRGALLFVVEDLHWADPSTLELLGRLVQERSECRLLVVLTARPEFANPWSRRCAELTLSRLADPDAAAIVSWMAHGKTVPPEALELVLTRAEGVPLFTEELTKALVEAGVLREEQDGYSFDRAALSSAEIPSTLHGLLMARLDRLGRSRQTAELAAALGREFPLPLLTAASADPEEVVLDDLAKLVDAGLVHRVAAGSDTFAFKHALVRDAAYDLLPSRTRHTVHARIAGALEQSFAEIVNARPGLLARHHAAAGDRRKAMGYAQRAAQAALQRSAYLETINHVQQAFEWLDAFDAGRERDETELALNGLVTPALMSSRGWAHEDVRVKIERSQELIDSVGPSPHAAPTLWGLIVYHHTRGTSRARARRAAERLLDMAVGASDTSLHVAALCMVGACSWIEGRLADARAAFERLLQLYDPQAHRGLGLMYGMDPKVVAHTGLSQVTWQQGDPDRALAEVRSAIAWSRELNEACALTMSYWYAAMLHQQRREPDKALELIGTIHELASRHGLAAQLTYVGVIRCWVTGDVERSRHLMAALEASGHELGLTYYRTVLAQTEAARGEREAALANLEMSLVRGRRSGELYNVSQVLRLKGEILREHEPAAEAEARACVWQAIEAARVQGALMAELEATVTSCRMAPDEEEAERARRSLARLLAQVVGGDGVTLPVIEEARALLRDAPEESSRRPFSAAHVGS